MSGSFGIQTPNRKRFIISPLSYITIQCVVFCKFALTIAAVVARAAHRIPDAALPALLALETDTARQETELLATAFLITLAD